MKPEYDRHEWILFHRDGTPEPIAGLRRRILIWALRGHSVFCSICGGHFSTFVPFRPFGTPWPSARCPVCRSLDRTRFLYLFLKDETQIFSAPGTLLHVAPEPELYKLFRKSKNLTYIPCDKFSKGYRYLRGTRFMDITAIPMADNTVDYVLCSHVLEHIPDDRLAMREIRRILRPEGWAIFMVPQDRNLEQTFEDPAIVTPEQRHEAYWQHDHYRLYGKDFHLRLNSVGFGVTEEVPAKRFSKEEAFRLGFRRYEKLFFCRKNSEPPVDGERPVNV